jgi:mRNA interferase RelE/StbE
MSYELGFKMTALKEWNKLGATIQTQFKKKLRNVLDNPRIPGAKLSGANDLYKIKLRQSGYRLVYEVNDQLVMVTVIAVGKREGAKVYKAAMKRTDL